MKLQSRKLKPSLPSRRTRRFERHYKLNAKGPPATTSKPTTRVAAPNPPPPTSKLMSLANQIPFKPSSTANKITLTRNLEESSSIPRLGRITQASPSQVPNPISYASPKRTLLIRYPNDSTYITTDHSNVSSTKRLLPIGTTPDRPVKHQRTSPPKTQHLGDTRTPVAGQHVQRPHRTSRRFHAHQHRALNGECHEIRFGRFLDGLQGTMGPRTSQTETQRDQEASQGIPEGHRSQATTGSIWNEACPPNHGDHTQVKRHRAPAQQEQEQVTTTKCHAQKHQESLPRTVVPSASQSQPVPPHDGPPRSPATSVGHLHGTPRLDDPRHGAAAPIAPLRGTPRSRSAVSRTSTPKHTPQRPRTAATTVEH